MSTSKFHLKHINNIFFNNIKQNIRFLELFSITNFFNIVQARNRVFRRVCEIHTVELVKSRYFKERKPKINHQGLLSIQYFSLSPRLLNYFLQIQLDWKINKTVEQPPESRPRSLTCTVPTNQLQSNTHKYNYITQGTEVKIARMCGGALFTVLGFFELGVGEK